MPLWENESTFSLFKLAICEYFIFRYNFPLSYLFAKPWLIGLTGQSSITNLTSKTVVEFLARGTGELGVCNRQEPSIPVNLNKYQNLYFRLNLSLSSATCSTWWFAFQTVLILPRSKSSLRVTDYSSITYFLAFGIKHTARRKSSKQIQLDIYFNFFPQTKLLLFGHIFRARINLTSFEIMQQYDLCVLIYYFLFRWSQN